MALFDTLSYVRCLREGGIPDKQAEAHSSALTRAFQEGVAKASDVQSLEVQVAAVSSRVSLLIWFVGLIFTLSVAVLALLVRLLP